MLRRTAHAADRARRLARAERGAALLVVTFLLVIVLVGGLAAVAVTSGELASSSSYRARAATEACAQAAIERIRALVTDTMTASATEGTIDVGGRVLRYRSGHYGVASLEPLTELTPDQFDPTALVEGMNITNNLWQGGGGGGSGGGLCTSGVHILTTTVTCSGDGFGEREIQLVLRCGTQL